MLAVKADWLTIERVKMAAAHHRHQPDLEPIGTTPRYSWHSEEAAMARAEENGKK